MENKNSGMFTDSITGKVLTCDEVVGRMAALRPFVRKLATRTYTAGCLGGYLQYLYLNEDGIWYTFSADVIYHPELDVDDTFGFMLDEMF